MRTTEVTSAMTRLFSELSNGVTGREGFVLNTGDIGLLKSLEKISAAEASRSVNGGATIAAHAQHLRYGLSLMNEWAARGNNPFANAKWDEAWRVTAVNEAEWIEIRNGLRAETEQWQQVLHTPRDVADVELAGMMASIAHLAYHVGAIRQINKEARGPKEGTFQEL